MLDLTHVQNLLFKAEGAAPSTRTHNLSETFLILINGLMPSDSVMLSVQVSPSDFKLLR